MDEKNEAKKSVNMLATSALDCDKASSRLMVEGDELVLFNVLR